jgi:hypothetical protein
VLDMCMEAAQRRAKPDRGSVLHASDLRH